MKKFVLTGLLLCLVLPATAQTRTFSETYSVDATALLRLRNVNGDLKIRTADVSTITINAVSYFERSQDSQFLDEIEYLATNTGTRLTFSTKFNTWDHPYDCDEDTWRKTVINNTVKASTVTTNGLSAEETKEEDDKWTWSWGTCYPRGPVTDYDIIVPIGSSLRITMDEGTLDIEAPTGTVRLDADEGTGEIRNLVNDLILETDEGEFDLYFAQMANAQVESDEGQLRFKFAQAGDFSLSIDAEEDTEMTFIGRDITVEWDDDEQFVRYTEGAATYELNFEASEGSLELEFLD